MLIDNIIYYEEKLYVEINKPGNPFYYFFDYDERSYDINMEFQHFHSFYEIHILLDDAANHIIEGTPYRLKKFDIVCLKPSLLHKSEYPNGPSVKRLVIQFLFPVTGTGIEEELNHVLELFDNPLPIYRFQQNDLFRLFEPLNEICRIKQNNLPLAALQIHNKFLEFLSLVYSNRSRNIYTPQKLDPSSNKIYSVTSYIHSHYGEPLSLELLSKMFFISPYHLSHQFHQVTGFTLTSYIQMTRIRNAQQQLLYTSKKITDIAEQCGFTSFSQFNRVFNKFCDSSPREFKTANTKTDSPRKIIPINVADK